MRFGRRNRAPSLERSPLSAGSGCRGGSRSASPAARDDELQQTARTEPNLAATSRTPRRVSSRSRSRSRTPSPSRNPAAASSCPQPSSAQKKHEGATTAQTEATACSVKVQTVLREYLRVVGAAEDASRKALEAEASYRSSEARRAATALKERRRCMI